MKTGLALSTVLVTNLLCGIAGAAAVYVDAASGDNADDGSTWALAVLTVERGLELVGPGDELVLGPGTYYETVEISGLGTSASQPLLIRAEPTGSATISAMWEDAANGAVTWQDEGGGVYSAAHGPALFGGWGGHLPVPVRAVGPARWARRVRGQ